MSSVSCCDAAEKEAADLIAHSLCLTEVIRVVQQVHERVSTHVNAISNELGFDAVDP
jgi:hypothetical protein